MSDQDHIATVITVEENPTPFFRMSKYWWIVLITALGFSLCRGLRLPNLWSMTHYLFSYQIGCHKRAMFGSILHLFSETYTYATLAIIAFAVTFAFLLLLLFVIRKADQPLIVLCFLASPGLVYIFHIVGYFDNIAILIGALCLIAHPYLNFGMRSFAILAATIFAALVHEVNLVYLAPFFLLLWLHDRSDLKLITFITLLYLTVIGGLVAAVNYYGQLDDISFKSVQEAVHMRAKFGIREDAVYVQKSSFASYFSFLQEILARPRVFDTNMQSLLVFLPFSLLMYALSLRALIVRRYPMLVLLFMSILSFFSCFSSLILRYVAWDFHRWHAMTQLMSFLTLLAITQGLRLAIPRGVRWATALTIVTLLNLQSMQWFFDGYQQEFFPLYNSVLAIWPSLANGILPRF